MAGAGLAMAPLMPSARVLPGGPTRVLPWHCDRPRQGACRGSCGFPRLGSCRGSPSSGPHVILCIYDLHKDLHATTEVPPEPWFQCSWLGWNPWAQGWLALLVLGKLPQQGSCRGRGGRPGKGLARGSTSPSCSLVFLVLSLSQLSCASGSLRLPSSALLSVVAARGSDRPRTSKGVKRRAPTFVHRQCFSNQRHFTP